MLNCYNSGTSKTVNVTIKDVGAASRHDMQSFVQLPSVSGNDGELGLKMGRRSL